MTLARDESAGVIDSAKSLDRPTVAFLISRQGRRPSPESWWIHATLAAARWAYSQRYAFLGGAGLMHLDFARWAYAYCGGEVLLVDVSAHPTMRRSHQELHDLGITERRFILEVNADADKRELYRRRDAFITTAADTLVAVAVRGGGIMESLGREALEAGKLVYAIPPPSRAKAFAGNRALLDAGAEPLTCDISPPPTSHSAERAPSSPNVNRTHINAADYLWHYTRACAGPWPEQSWNSYFESLANNTTGAAHSGLDTLYRILGNERIRASGFLIRRKYPVVCWSASEPGDLLELRRYRNALIRWDFEPYGIGIKRTVAESLGIRPVIYCAREEYASLPEVDRFLFQAHAPPKTDWTHEEEWRCLGDFSLADLAPQDACILVPSPAERNALATATRFPVIMLEDITP